MVSRPARFALSIGWAVLAVGWLALVCYSGGGVSGWLGLAWALLGFLDCILARMGVMKVALLKNFGLDSFQIASLGNRVASTC